MGFSPYMLECCYISGSLTSSCMQFNKYCLSTDTNAHWCMLITWKATKIQIFWIGWQSHYHKRPISQIPECTCSISHNAPFRTFLIWMEHCGVWNKCILGFVNYVNWVYQLHPTDIVGHNYLSLLSIPASGTTLLNHNSQRCAHNCPG